MKVDIFRIGSDCYAQAASGEMWRVRGNKSDHSATGNGLLPLPEGKLELLARMDVLRESGDKFSADLNSIAGVLRDVAQSIERVSFGDIMLDGKLLDAHLESAILSTERFAYKLDGDLMVCVLDADRQVPEWDVARKTTRMNIVAEAVLRANGFDDDAAKVMFHRTAGAYFV